MRLAREQGKQEFGASSTFGLLSFMDGESRLASQGHRGQQDLKQPQTLFGENEEDEGWN